MFLKNAKIRKSLKTSTLPFVIRKLFKRQNLVKIVVTFLSDSNASKLAYCNDVVAPISLRTVS